MKINSLTGVFPALVTPFYPDWTIREDSLRALVELNIGKGIDGFYVGGSTGEAFLLTDEERRRIFEITADQNRGRVKLIAHVGSISTNQSILLGQHAKELGADAISAVPPFYYGFSFEEIKQHYNSLADAVQLPLIVYNIPSLSGVELTADNVRELRQNPYIAGVKHTSMNLFQLERMLTADPDMVVFNGYDEIFLAGLSMGATGGIGSTYNFMAEKFLAIRSCFEQGRIQEAALLQQQANEMIQILSRVGVTAGIKYLLEKKYGICCGGCRPPFRKLSEEDKLLLDKAVEQYCTES